MPEEHITNAGHVRVEPIEWLQTTLTGSLPRIPNQYPDLLNEVQLRDPLGREIAREVISQNLEVSLFPTLGCFQPGYLLISPTLQVNSFSELGTEDITKVQKVVELWRNHLSALMGEAIIAEHGSSSSCDTSAACIAHAHLHLIPLPGLKNALRDQYYTAGGAPDLSLNSLSELSAAVDGQPYVLFSGQAGEFEVWLDVEKFPRQFVRRQTAKLLGIPEMYNWRLYPFVEQMELSHSLLNSAFNALPKVNDSAIHSHPIWKTPYDIPQLIEPQFNPHVTIFTEKNVERLLFFAACRAKGIAEEALDQLRRIHETSGLTPTQIQRGVAIAYGPLREFLEVCTGRAALDFLTSVGKAPESPPNLYGEDED